MKIDSSAIRTVANHFSEQRREFSESLNAWSGNRAPNAAQSMADAGMLPSSRVSLSAAASSTQADAIRQGLEAADNDPMLRLLRAMIEVLTGHAVTVFDAGSLASSDATAPAEVPAPSATPAPGTTTPTGSAAANPAPANGGGIDYQRTETYRETERTHFAAEGLVRTSDGQEIRVSIQLDMARSFQQQSTTRIRLGEAARSKDPLVLNFGGTAAQLTARKFSFDLDADGQSEHISFASSGSGFLAIDRNGDGKINNGSELFGPRSGDGFADLAQLDADGNGWIDENDPAFTSLRLWTKDASGNDRLATLAEADVGALSLGRSETPFALKDETNALLGQIRSTGFFLRESGGAGTLQQVDLAV